jgi:hypothetical protein
LIKIREVVKKVIVLNVYKQKNLKTIHLKFREIKKGIKPMITLIFPKIISG